MPFGGKRQKIDNDSKKYHLQKIYIGKRIDDWNALKTNLGVKNDVELATLLLQK